MRTLRSTYLFALAAALGALATTATAETYILPFTDLVDGYMPGGTDVATLTIEDWGADTVKFTLLHGSGSTSGQFITDLWFNLDPYVAVTQADKTPLALFDNFYAGEDGQPNAMLYFDLRQTFVHNASERFDPGESISFTLSGSGLNAADFMAFAAHDPAGWDNVIAMIHIQGVGEGGLNSGKLAVVPEPASLAVIGLGLAALIRRRRPR